MSPLLRDPKLHPAPSQGASPATRKLHNPGAQLRNLAGPRQSTEGSAHLKRDAGPSPSEPWPWPSRPAGGPFNGRLMKGGPWDIFQAWPPSTR